MSELTILLTATIQADLKSDNFLTICTALHAIPTIANVELANIFLPEVVGLVKHDRDQVKKRALITLHSLLLVDPSIGDDIGQVFVEKLGYKEPAVMFAVLPGLYDLIKLNPKPYQGLVHYFTNILKQASEGKLGRSWVVHRAPAPFLQITLLRLLGLLGANNAQVSSDMQVILVDVWKRAQALMSQAGNAILFECMKTATTIVPSDTLYSLCLDTAAVFLNSTDNNLKCAGIEILSRMIRDGDAGKVQQHQMAIVEALRSPDVTLKGRTVDLIFQMTTPSNINVVLGEVLEFIGDDSIDEETRKSAASSLLHVAEKFAPSLSWFVDSITNLLQQCGNLSPVEAEHSLIRALKDGSGGTDPAADLMLRNKTTHTYFDMLSGKKLSAPLMKVICWTLGEYGIDAGLSAESICSTLTDMLESHTTSAALSETCIMALSKISIRTERGLSEETMALLRSLGSSEILPVRQAAFEACSVAEKRSQLQGKALFRVLPGNSFTFLDDISNTAIREGAAQYLSREERESMGMMHEPTRVVKPFQRDLKFEAYERQEAQKAVMKPSDNHQPHQMDDLLGDFAIGDSRTTGLEDPAPESSTETLHVGRSSSQRRWGPTSTPSSSSKPNETRDERQSRAKDTTPTSTYTMPQQHVDPQQELLAASLFGTGSGPTAPAGIHLSSKMQPTSDSLDLLDLGADEDAAPQQRGADQGDASLLDLLVDGSSLPVTSAQPNQTNDMDIFASFETDALPVVEEPAHPPARPSTQESTPDPFKGLLD